MSRAHAAARLTSWTDRGQQGSGPSRRLIVFLYPPQAFQKLPAAASAGSATPGDERTGLPGRALALVRTLNAARYALFISIRAGLPPASRRFARRAPAELTRPAPPAVMASVREGYSAQRVASAPRRIGRKGASRCRCQRAPPPAPQRALGTVAHTFPSDPASLSACRSAA